jgi:DNA-binding winged helix-turn-helix (wHTH) protein
VRARFGPYVVDSESRQLLNGDSALHLSPKAFDLLCTLLEHRPKVLKKADLHALIWPRTFVVEGNLNVLVGEIRRAIGDDAQHPRFIRTVHRIGYAFCGDAVDLREAPASTASMQCWVVFQDRTFRLSEGDTLVGRDPQCAVWLHEPGVSRRHASIRIDSGDRRVTLHDLGSTNGTFVRRSRVRTAVDLGDGDSIRIGSVELTFRLWAEGTGSKTKRRRIILDSKKERER